MNKTIIFAVLTAFFLVGCEGGELPESVVKDIRDTYANINSYSAELQIKMGDSKFDADQEMQLSVQRPDKYRREVVKVMDRPYEGFEICNGDTLYTYEEGKGSTQPWECEGFVGATFNVIEKLQSFNPERADTEAKLEDNNVRIKIALHGQESYFVVWVERGSYLIKRIRYHNVQPDGSVTTRTEEYKNIILNREFSPDEFLISKPF